MLDTKTELGIMTLHGMDQQLDKNQEIHKITELIVLVLHLEQQLINKQLLDQLMKLTGFIAILVEVLLLSLNVFNFY